MQTLIPNRGNYKKLLSYQKSNVIFELTYYFCHKYLSKGDRTIDQMVQAARSGKQYIIELKIYHGDVNGNFNIETPKFSGRVRAKDGLFSTPYNTNF